MKSPAHQLALYLGNAGVVCGVGQEPPQPDNVVTLYDTGGAGPVLYEGQLRQPTIQVRVRNTSYPEAYNLQNDIFGILNAIVDQEIDGSQFIGCWMQSEIISIGRDDNNRHILTSNYRIERG